MSRNRDDDILGVYVYFLRYLDELVQENIEGVKLSSEDLLDLENAGRLEKVRIMAGHDFLGTIEYSSSSKSFFVIDPVGNVNRTYKFSSEDLGCSTTLDNMVECIKILKQDSDEYKEWEYTEYEKKSHKEDVMAGDYSDPMIMDGYSEERVNNFSENVEKLAKNLKDKKKLNESELKYWKKHKNMMLDYNEAYDENEPYGVSKERKAKVNQKDPWLDEKVLNWPNYALEEYEKEMEVFRKRPESNTGYENNALNDKMRERWGNQRVNKCIDGNLFNRKVGE